MLPPAQSSEKPKSLFFLFSCYFFVLTNYCPPPSQPPTTSQSDTAVFLPVARFALVVVVRNILENEMVHLHGCAHVSIQIWDAVQLHSAGELNSVGVLVELEPSAASHMRAPQTLHKQAWRFWAPFPSSRILCHFLPVLAGLTDLKLPAFCLRLRAAPLIEA